MAAPDDLFVTRTAIEDSFARVDGLLARVAQRLPANSESTRELLAARDALDALRELALHLAETRE